MLLEQSNFSWLKFQVLWNLFKPNLKKIDSCLNWSLNKDQMKTAIVNLICINWTHVYFKHNSWSKMMFILEWFHCICIIFYLLTILNNFYIYVNIVPLCWLCLYFRTTVLQSMKLGIDVNRHKEIIVKAISGLTLLLLKHFKLNHVYQVNIT